MCENTWSIWELEVLGEKKILKAPPFPSTPTPMHFLLGQFFTVSHEQSPSLECILVQTV